MCAICRFEPCHPRCPNASPMRVAVCAACGEDILPGDEYGKIECAAYHLECLAAMPVQEILALCGISIGTAEAPCAGFGVVRC